MVLSAVAARDAIGLLQQTVYWLDEGVGSIVGHAAHDRVGTFCDRSGQLLERLKPAALSPAESGVQVGPRELRIVARRDPRIDLAKRHPHG